MQFAELLVCQTHTIGPEYRAKACRAPNGVESPSFPEHPRTRHVVGCLELPCSSTRT
jgi:hypothetical protein